MRLVIISGRSGSGKSISLHVLEDLGFYCIDNLPAGLLHLFVDHIEGSYDKVAIGIDARNLPQDLDKFHTIIETLQQHGHRCEIIYLDADDTTLIKRYSETRRKHPLSNQARSLKEAIQTEQALLQPIAHLADLRVDTTHYNLHQLSELISERISPHHQKLSLLIQSFGYKFGVPPDSDYVFDVRCLPNPYWQLELRPFTGLEPKIQAFLSSKVETLALLTDIRDFLDKWIPAFHATNRNYMTIAIGCTGGQHRSVYIAEQLMEHFLQKNLDVKIRHRELT